jgi:hypothetical protein
VYHSWTAHDAASTTQAPSVISPICRKTKCMRRRRANGERETALPETKVYVHRTGALPPDGPQVTFVGRGSDHRPAAGAKDRLGAKEPKNQGKNVSSLSHGFLPLHIKRLMGRFQQRFIFLCWFSRPDGENNSEHASAPRSRRRACTACRCKLSATSELLSRYVARPVARRLCSGIHLETAAART